MHPGVLPELGIEKIESSHIVAEKFGGRVPEPVYFISPQMKMPGVSAVLLKGSLQMYLMDL